jgi:anti-sigma B factor antagonist
MTRRIRSVSIRKLPAQIARLESKAIFDDLESCIAVERPAVVLDCSMLRVVDRPALHLLLCCLEEAIKRNGDVRLAALHPEVHDLLRSAGVASLFQCYDTISEAVESYHPRHVEFAPLHRPVDSDQESEMSAA